MHGWNMLAIEFQAIGRSIMAGTYSIIDPLADLLLPAMQG